ncbi:MAG: CRTAC1 family protein [Rhizobiaceae bacterium]
MRRVFSAGLALAIALPAVAAEPVSPAFVDETASSGFDSVYSGQWQYMVGGGAAVFDCSGDGFPDMFAAGGEKPARFFRNTAKQGGPLHFVAETSGLELDAVTGAYPLDADADGNMDLVVLRVGENVIMRGLGQCRFERANEQWGFDGGDGWSTALAAFWEKGANWPTIAIGNYINRTEEMSPWGSCTANWLHRPLPGAEKFGPAAELLPSHCALSMLFTDWSGAGVPALRISNDREYYEGGQEQLWHVEPGKDPARYTVEEGWKPLKIWGMGIASRDLDGDARPEYFLTSMADNKLQALSPAGLKDKKPDYADIAYVRGVTAHRPYQGEDLKPSTAWHSEFADVNNDGLADLFIAKGNVDSMPDFASKDPNNLLLQGPGEKFIEAGGKAGVDSTASSRGAALADFNLDGLVDLVVVNRNDKAQVWRNSGPASGNWLQVRLRQDGPNRDAINSRLEIRTADGVSTREITIGGGHAGGQLGWLHAGLGPQQDAEIRVVWPDGESGEWQRLAANGFYLIERGKPAQAWQPASK